MDVSGATRQELQEYLENRGFAVYEKEDTEDLREAVRLDIPIAERAGWYGPDWHDPEKSLEDALDIRDEQRKARRWAR